MIGIYTFWAADECCNQKAFLPLVVFQLLSRFTCLCNSRNEVTPPRYYKVSISGYLQGLTPFHIKCYIFFLSASSPIIQASSFSLLLCKWLERPPILAVWCTVVSFSRSFHHKKNTFCPLLMLCCWSSCCLLSHAVLLCLHSMQMFLFFIKITIWCCSWN